MDDERRSGEEVPRARQLVEALCAAHADEHAAQVRQVELIGALCAAYATVQGAGPVLPGQERLVASGGEGTPMVAEHLATELAPKLQLTITAAGALISQSQDLLHRHPKVWAATQAGRLPVWQAKHIATATHGAGLSLEAATWVDQQLEPALGHLAWGRLKHKLAGLIVRADTALAARRAQQAQAERFVRVRQNGDGTALIVARTDAADAHRLDHTLTQLAGQLSLAGDTDPLDVLRAKALGVLAEPGHAVTLLEGPDAEPTTSRRRPARPTAELVIHLAPGSPVGRSEDLGPVLEHQVKEWLGHDRVVVRPVVDLHDNPAVDSYEVPAPIARIVRGRNPYDVFPWSNRTAQGLDLDHTRPFDHGPDAPGGQTCPDNLGPLSRRAHNAKTHAGWHLEQPEPGVYEWTTPLGYRYRVDETGTVELPPHRPDQPVPTQGGDGRSHRLEFPFTIDLRWPPAA